MLENKALGTMLGLAIGDAMGAPVEFRPKGKFLPVTGFRDGGPFKLKAGQWTDDTTMALCLAQSLIDRQGMDAYDQMDKYFMWVNEGFMSCAGKAVGIGQTVLKALVNYYSTKNPYQGLSDSKYSGNGCIMRLAPVPLYFHHDCSTAILESINSARTTHASRQSLQCTAYFAGLLWAALNGVDKKVLLQPKYSPCNKFEFNNLHEDVDRVVSGSFHNMEENELNPSGYVTDSLETALWGFSHFDNYEEGLLAVVNLGGDADTTGAIYGQLAGAYYGFENLPNKLVEGVAMNVMIRSIAVALVQQQQDENKNRGNGLT